MSAITPACTVAGRPREIWRCITQAAACCHSRRRGVARFNRFAIMADQ
ncbi:hypothetical protein NT01EI_3379 [Edwardsiella ictaluri 93-146]|uniref:Uncharacterized protein n=1 Tax=Edwardsiella ictaluri (strain 93-146) TaxID=634503 RepID=C5BAW1_EDWI9|nr:hypothetical protein NT01EI_3379 [Edwardsiella ictaluri 93-146]